MRERGEGFCEFLVSLISAVGVKDPESLQLFRLFANFLFPTVISHANLAGSKQIKQSLFESRNGDEKWAS
jgi:hypothetical protein